MKGEVFTLRVTPLLLEEKTFLSLPTPDNCDNFNLVALLHLSLRPKLAMENLTVVFHCH
jgi:hypothetical protein